jgi:hypothetical protein
MVPSAPALLADHWHQLHACGWHLERGFRGDVDFTWMQNFVIHAWAPSKYCCSDVHTTRISEVFSVIAGVISVLGQEVTWIKRNPNVTLPVITFDNNSYIYSTFEVCSLQHVFPLFLKCCSGGDVPLFARCLHEECRHNYWTAALLRLMQTASILRYDIHPLSKQL